MKAKIFVTGLVLMAATSFLNAQTTGRGSGQCQGKGTGAAFVDKNNNGICDNAENRQSGTCLKKRNGNGNGACGRKGQGKGRNYIDANKNGICDNRENISK